MLYLTYNDAPSGVYLSQVIDVCRFIKSSLNEDIRLLALISLRDFFKNRKTIKKELPTALVFPMFPKSKNWKKNKFIVKAVALSLGKKAIVCRGPFAACIALDLKKSGIIKKVCFDGRGAYTAELNEYDVVKDAKLKNEIEEIERRSVVQSDFRIGVSKKLIDYWKSTFEYSGKDHVVIPCTISSKEKFDFPSYEKIKKLKTVLGFSEDDVILVYSGSSAGWQSFKVVDAFIKAIMPLNEKIKFVMLARIELNTLDSYKLFPGRIQTKWLAASEVRDFLLACDYGVLLREDSTTNKVSSPTKFAEYLSAGLPVIISDNIGDFSEFVQKNNCGLVVKENMKLSLPEVTYPEKARCVEVAKKEFSKDAFSEEYKQVIVALKIGR